MNVYRFTEKNYILQCCLRDPWFISSIGLNASLSMGFLKGPQAPQYYIKLCLCSNVQFLREGLPKEM